MACRDYLDTVLRRSELKENSNDASVIIPRLEYEALIQASGDYAALRNALITGGVPPENLDLLITTQLPPPVKVEKHTTPSPVKQAYRPKWSAEARVFVPKSHFREWRISRSATESSHTSSTDGDENGALLVSECEEESEEEQYFEEKLKLRNFENNHEDRSLMLKGLSPFTTLADVLKYVKGGQILNAFILERQRSAHITFVDPIAAEKFLIYSKRADLYIRGKRIEVFWDDRQAYLAGHVARRIQCEGASRNIVVRFPKPDTTPESIKEDLGHIHRLQVVSVNLVDGHAWISLNSVYQAIVARSCMLSRFKYKGTRIEFYPDECDQALPPIPKKNYNSRAPSNSRPATVSYTNRYATLEGLASMNHEDESSCVNIAAGIVRGACADSAIVI